MADETTSILELVVGAINEREQYTSAKVNCGEKKEEGSIFPHQKLTVLFPENGENKVPLIGGSVVKIELGKKIVPSDEGVFGRIVSRIGQKLSGINSLKAFVENSSFSNKGNAVPANPSELATLHVKINNFLEKTGFFEKRLRTINIPTLELSSLISSEIEDFSDLNSEIERTKKIGTRVSGLTKVGSFKFIPFDTLKAIYETIINPDDEGEPQTRFEKNVTLAGDTFKKTYDNLNKETVDDDTICKAILNIFPILRIDEDIVLGEDNQPTIGYYTIYNTSIYLKTPDLSTRDASGYSLNPYGLSEERSENVTFAFELLIKGAYDAVSFNYQAPPTIEIADNVYEFPAESGGSVEIEVEAAGLGGNTSYYLSPINPAGKANISGVKNIKRVNDAVEFFTAPNLSAPYYNSISEPSKPLFALDQTNLTTNINQTTDLLDDNYSYQFGTDVKALTEDVISKLADSDIFQNVSPFLEKDARGYYIEILQEGSPSGNKIYIQDLGVPLFVNEKELGLNGSDYCGFANRPDIYLGRRTFDRSFRRNDRKYLSEKIYASKEFFMSIAPNIADPNLGMDEPLIPKLWVKSSAISNEDSAGIKKIEFGSRQEGYSSIADFNNNKEGGVEFALYAVDDLGQISRASGPNIILEKYEANLTVVVPSGFEEDGVIIQVGKPMPELTIELEKRPEFESLKVYDSKTDGTLLLTLNDIDVKKTSSGFIIDFGGQNVEDVFGTNIGTVYLEVNDSDDRIPFFIASADVITVEQLPSKKSIDDKVLFQDPNGLSAIKFGKRIDSIPLLLDGSNAKITLKYNKKVLKSGSEIYAYFAISGTVFDGKNKDILKEDIGFSKSLGLQENLDSGFNLSKKIFIKNAIITKEDGFKLYCIVPTNIEYKFESTYFKRISDKKAVLSFPGPAGNLNISRFNEFEAINNQSPAYIILTNKKLSDDSIDTVFLNSESNEYAIIPVGSDSGETDEDNIKPAFIEPPYIVGMAAKIPGRSGSFASSNAKLADYSEQIKGISEEDLKAEDNVGPIITEDGLDRLALVFTGSNFRVDKRAYTAFIGSKSIRQYRAGSLKKLSAKDNLLLLNFKKIKDIKDVGWTNITIKKKDKRFNVDYDSTVYNISTIKFDCAAELPDLNCNDIVKITGSGKNEIATLASGKNKYILARDGSQKLIYSESANIFPSVNTTGLFKIPYSNRKLADGEPGRLDAATAAAGPLDKDLDQTSTSFAYFRNPIKIFPDSDLFADLFLTDTDTSKKSNGESKNPNGEKTLISTNGTLGVDLGLDELKEAKDSLLEKGEELKNQAQEAVDSVREAAEEAGEGLSKTPEELTEEADQGQEQIDAYDENASAADSAVQKAEDADAALAEAEQQVRDLDSNAGEEAIAAANQALEKAQAALDSALSAANEAVDGLNNAISTLNSLLDKLSRLSMIAEGILDDLEDALGVSDRAGDFYGIRISNIAIDKDAAIQTGKIVIIGEEESRLNFKTRFDQVAAIKFNSPEILAITKKGDDKLVLPSEFRSIIIDDEPATLILRTIGTSKGTKLEINKVRTDFSIVKETGIVKDLEVKIKSKNDFLLSGLDPCLEIALTNSNENRLLLSDVDNDLAIDINSVYANYLEGGARVKKGPPGELKEKLEDAYLRFTSVKLEKANIAKEFIQSFCDMSFHLTAELSLQLRNFKVLLVPIKVILCIIDVICALLHPIRLAFAIIRLFLCLYDLILLLPQLAVPAMLINLLLHILELLLCVIVKMLSIVNAINEIISAFDVAIREKNYPAIIALEETLNEHLISLEADLEVLEPIITILGLFLELLELVFAFPCQIGSDEDDPACIDPSMLAGIILGKVAPFGRIEPDALLPMAQTYTTLDPADTNYGNTPSSGNDEDPDRFGSNDVLKETRENAGADVVPSNAGYGGNDLTGLTDSITGEPIVIGDNGFFSGDGDEDGRLDNIDYTTLRFDDNGTEFQASFGMSFTKSVKKFNLFTGPDPRLVEFQFNERGLTNPLAFNFFLAAFFRKKNIDTFQNMDSPPGFVIADGSSLVVNDGQVGFTSPVDGSSDFSGGSFTGFYLDDTGGGYYQPKTLTAKVDVDEFAVDPETGEQTVVTTEVFKTFANVPMVALVDDEFNVYFVEEGDGGQGGIKVETIDGVECITSISAKMINYPTAPKRKLSREDREVYRDAESLKPKSDRAKDLETGLSLTGSSGPETVSETADVKLGQILVYEQANANWLSGEFVAGGTAEEGGNYFNGDEEFKSKNFNDDFGSYTAQYVKDEFDDGNDVNGVLFGPPNNISDPPFPDYGIFDWANGSKKEKNDFGDSIDSIKVFDFPVLHFIDMRHVADDIAAACGSKPTEFLLDQDVFTEDGQKDVEDLVEETQDCVQSFLDFFLSSKETTPGVPDGVVPRIRSQLDQGIVPDLIVVDDVITKYNDTRECIEDKVDRACKFVINPLNSSFKLLADTDETPLTDFVNPEQEDLANLANFDIVDELEFDSELQGFPQITGAMEYASGIGDLAAVTVGDKALIKIIPRDCYDEPLPATLKLTDSILIEILEDETGGAELVEPEEGSGLIVKDETEYTAAISSNSIGAVKIKATICSVTVQAVTDRSISAASGSSAEVDCVDDDGVDPGADEEAFAPGALTKVDRVLTILFTAAPEVADIEDDSGRLATPRPQVFGTNLEN